jgi:hypothetical protein
MRAAIFTTDPYMEMTVTAETLMAPSVEDGVVTWRVPLADGAVPHVALSDCGYYVRWLFEHPDRASGMDLSVAIAHIPYAELAAAFEKVTGKPARYIDTKPEDFFTAMGPMASRPAGYNADLKDPATMTFHQNFSGFWTIWRHSGGNEGVVRKDYALLDEIHPNRIRSAEDWFRMEDARGRELGLGSLWERVQPEKIEPLLKLIVDKLQGTL